MAGRQRLRQHRRALEPHVHALRQRRARPVEVGEVVQVLVAVRRADQRTPHLQHAPLRQVPDRERVRQRTPLPRDAHVAEGVRAVEQHVAALRPEGRHEDAVERRGEAVRRVALLRREGAPLRGIRREVGVRRAVEETVHRGVGGADRAGPRGEDCVEVVPALRERDAVRGDGRPGGPLLEDEAVVEDELARPGHAHAEAVRPRFRHVPAARVGDDALVAEPRPPPGGAVDAGFRGGRLRDGERGEVAPVGVQARRRGRGVVERAEAGRRVVRRREGDHAVRAVGEDAARHRRAGGLGEPARRMVERIHDLHVAAARPGDELRRERRAERGRHLDGGRIDVAGGDQERVARPAEEAVAVGGERGDGRRERRAERDAGGHRRAVGHAAVDLHRTARAGARRDEVLHLLVHRRVDGEARRADVRVLGGDPLRRGGPAPEARLVERATEEGLVAVRIASEGERQAVVGRDGRNVALHHARAVAEDLQRVPVVGERDEPPVRRHVGEVARHGRVVPRRPRREPRGAAVGQLDLPAVVVRVGVLAREDARIAGHAVRPDPGGDRERRP